MIRCFTALVIALGALTSLVGATEVTPPEDPEIAKLRQGLLDSFNSGNVDKLLTHLTDDCVVTWQNVEVCRGPAEVRAYYDKMMTGSNKVVASATADPKILGRNMHGDWAVSWGAMHDHFTLTDGSDLPMDSRFTAVIVKQNDAWKISAFHVSLNAFDNSILRLAVQKTLLWSAGAAGVATLLIGLVIGRVTKRTPKP